MVTNANINIVQFMTQKKKRNHECSNTWCSIFKYQFQNALVKLLFESDFYPLVLIEHKKTFYVLESVSIAPFLINEPRTTAIHHEGFNITQSHIFHILANNPTPLHFPFSIALYTSFSYTIPNQQQNNRSNLIGWHQGTKTTLHLFLTPAIENTPVFLTILDSTNTHKKITCLKNIYSTSHLTEGINHVKNQKTTPAPPLNQNFCVCAHAKTSQFIVPSGNHAFKPLGQLCHIIML